jgi:hypothetical protein
MALDEKLSDLLRAYLAKDGGRDAFLYTGDFIGDEPDEFIDLIVAKKTTSESASVFVTSYGGDPHAAYRVGRCLQEKYKKLRFVICGPCKSAATLLIISGDSLTFAPTGELGPLDVQLTKPDELVANSSGLDIFQAMSALVAQSVDAFEHHLIRITKDFRARISAKTACAISEKLVSVLFRPIAAQIDPLRLAEAQRALTIADRYGNSLNRGNLKRNALGQLIQGFPSHGFVIDLREARKYFERVVPAEAEDLQVLESFSVSLRHPSEESRFADLCMFIKPQEVQNEAQGAGELGAGIPPTAEREPGDGRPIQPTAAG